MRYELRSISIWAFIKVSFLFNLVVGFVLGLLYVPFLALIASMGEMYPIFGVEPVTFEISGVWMVLLPLLFAIMGAFLSTAVGLALLFVYNAISALLGGLEIRLEPVGADEHPTAYRRPPVTPATVKAAPVDSPSSTTPAQPPRPAGTPPPPPPVGARPAPLPSVEHETGGKDEA